MLNYNTMMSAVLIKYWLRYKKKKKRKERQKDLLLTLVESRKYTDLRIYVIYFGLQWFMSYSDF